MLFTALIDCENCQLAFHGQWAAEVLDLQQLEEAPVADQICPGCRHVHKDVEYPGWTFFGEAG